MIALTARNVNDAYQAGCQILQKVGILTTSRYGDVLRSPQPITTRYEKPNERVLFHAKRDANPFLHLFDALWILQGRQDVAWLSRFAARMREFSDDGTTYWGAYGHRLRTWFGYDQLKRAVELLRKDPKDRRVVLSIWDGRHDLGKASKDIPCNDLVKLDATHGALNAYVFNRSNDIIWGAYGANAVQFSILLEYLAAMSGMPMGVYEQISTDFHAYTNVWVDKAPINTPEKDPYAERAVASFPLVTYPDEWDRDLFTFFAWACGPVEDLDQTDASVFADPFFAHVAFPLYQAHHLWKLGLKGEAFDTLDDVKATDWQLAAKQWMERRVDINELARQSSTKGIPTNDEGDE